MNTYQIDNIFQVQVTAPMEANEYNIPSVATYADATNVSTPQVFQ
jgi:hypothetical protein